MPSPRASEFRTTQILPQLLLLLLLSAAALARSARSPRLDFFYRRMPEPARALRRSSSKAHLSHPAKPRRPVLCLPSQRTKFHPARMPGPRYISFSDQKIRSSRQPPILDKLFRPAKFPHTAIPLHQKQLLARKVHSTQTLSPLFHLYPT